MPPHQPISAAGASCAASPRPSIAVVVKGYPRLSETFIAQEILALERRGLELRIVSLRHPTDSAVHPVHREIDSPVSYLPEYLWHEPMRVVRGWRRVRRLPGYAAARRSWLADLRHDPTPNRVRRFGQALVLAAELDAQCRLLYAHFLHTPASVARYTALMRGLPWAASAHAKDVWTTPEHELAGKLAECSWVTTCTAANADHLRALSPRPERVHLVYHGLDLERFAPAQRRGAGTDHRLTILTVGRAVEKKGIEDLLEALAMLAADRRWRFIHVGGGPLLARLRQTGRRLGIDDRLQWLGALPQERVLECYRTADLFVLPSRLAADGDRDGLPNVLMEAQSQGLACVSTTLSGIPELIEHGRTGLLVAPGDRRALADAIATLLDDADLRARLGEAGAERVRRRFAADRNVGVIENLLRATLAA